MFKLIALLVAACLLFGCGSIDDNTVSIGIIGGADGPTSVFISTGDNPCEGTLTLSFDANITTGYKWSAVILGGRSVVIDEALSVYVPYPNPYYLDGLGGTQYYTLRAAEPGESIIRFCYSRGSESDAIREVIMLAQVEDDLSIITQDVTESGVLDGTVTAADACEYSIIMDSDSGEEFIVYINSDAEMPETGERIRVYTNGIMTMSLPPIVNAIAWESLQPADEYGYDIQMLDGPGSYIEIIEGAVTEITVDDEYSFTMIILVDEDYSYLCETEYCMVVVDCNLGSKPTVPKSGDHVLVSFPGGVYYDGDPMKIITQMEPLITGD